MSRISIMERSGSINLHLCIYQYSLNHILNPYICGKMIINDRPEMRYKLETLTSIGPERKGVPSVNASDQLN